LQRSIDKGLRNSHLRHKGDVRVPRIEIYTKFLCPYCSRAKALLTSKGVSFDEIDVTMDASLRRTMIDRANGGSTVPQIFIDGRHVGGCDDLHALDARGELDPLLAS
jgi:glutaredoxin 3